MPGRGRVAAPLVSGDREADVDVVARGVRIGARLVRGFDEPLSLSAVHARQPDDQIDGEAEAALARVRSRPWAVTVASSGTCSFCLCATDFSAL